MSSEKKLQVVIDGVESAEARASAHTNLKEQYSKSSQNWEEVEQRMVHWKKMHDEFGPLALAVFYIEPEDEAKAFDTCCEFWPDAVVEAGSGEHDLYGFCHYVKVTFNQVQTTDK